MAEEAPVLVAGDPEAAHMEVCDKAGGIPYHPNQIDHAVKLQSCSSLSRGEVHFDRGAGWALDPSVIAEALGNTG